MRVPVPGSPSPPPLLCPAGIRGVDPPWGLLAELPVGLQLLLRGCPVGACGVPGPWRLRMATPPASGALGAPPGLCMVQTGKGPGGGREHPPNRPDPSLRACALALPGDLQSSLGPGPSVSCVFWRLSDCPKEKNHVKRGVGWGGCWSLRAVPRVSAVASTLCTNSQALDVPERAAWDAGVIAP